MNSKTKDLFTLYIHILLNAIHTTYIHRDMLIGIYKDTFKKMQIWMQINMF